MDIEFLCIYIYMKVDAYDWEIMGSSGMWMSFKNLLQSMHGSAVY